MLAHLKKRSQTEACVWRRGTKQEKGWAGPPILGVLGAPEAPGAPESWTVLRPIRQTGWSQEYPAEFNEVNKVVGEEDKYFSERQIVFLQKNFKWVGSKR